MTLTSKVKVLKQGPVYRVLQKIASKVSVVPSPLVADILLEARTYRTRIGLGVKLLKEPVQTNQNK